MVDPGRAPLGDTHAVDDVVLLNFLHHVEPIDDLAENGVHAIEVPAAGVAQHDEELAATGILAGVGHGESADLMRLRIAGGLTLDLVAGPPGANPGVSRRKISGEGIATLDDEIRDHAVEFDAVVEPAIGELLEVLDGLWGLF